MLAPHHSTRLLPPRLRCHHRPGPRAPASPRALASPPRASLSYTVATRIPLTPALSAVYDELLLRAASPPFDAQARQLRAAFELRAGSFPPEHPARSARDAASWEDALLAGGLALLLAPSFDDPSERSLVLVFSRAQQGVFVPVSRGKVSCLQDLWGGGEFLLLPRDDIGRALGEVQGVPFVGRIVAGSDGCAVLPGRVWLPEEALPFFPEIFHAARARSMEVDAVVDALLWMEHRLASMSRIKPQVAFRPEGLDRRAPGSRR